MVNRFEREGQEVGDYRLLKGLGKGGFGDVYLGEHIREHTQAAVKVLRTRLTRSDELKEFINEARTMRLKHPHIVSLLDFGIGNDDVPFLVMVYAPHGSLRDRHAKGSRLLIPTVVSYVSDIASALQYAHEQHLIHRDVKPENMLIGPNGEILLSDFGIAAVAHSTRSIVTNEGIGGTLPYMAPEQIIGKTRPASDQYALAVVVYEWLCGTRPFNGTSFELLAMHREATPPSLREQVPTLSPDVEQIVLKALAKEPKQRFDNVQEFATALQEASKKQNTTALPEQSFHSVFPQPPLYSSHALQPPAEQVNMTPPIITQPSFIMPTPHTPSTPNFPPVVEETPRFIFSANDTSASTFVDQPVMRLSPQMLPYPYPLPEQRGKQSVHQISTTSKILLFLLVVILLIGASVGLVYTTGKVATDNANATATAQTYATATISTRLTIIAQAHATATSQAQRVADTQAQAATNGLMFGFNAQHTHANPYERILSSTTVSALTKKWAFLTGDSIASDPTVVNGVVYVGSRDHNLYAIDATSGTKKWAFLTGDLIDSSPAVVNGVVYVGSRDRNLYAIDAASGTKKWAFLTGSGYGIDSSPAVVNGVVYVGSPDGNVYAIDAASGTKKWAFLTGSTTYSSPAVVNGVVYVGSLDGNVYAIDATSGTKKWAFLTGREVFSSPAVVNGVVYVGSWDDNLYAIDAASGTKKWAFLTGNLITSSPAVVNSVVYVGSEDHSLYAIDAASGTKKWAYQTKGAIASDAVVANGMVYVGSWDHNLYAIDATSGTKKWAFLTGGIIYASPTVADGVVYVGSEDHILYAFHLPNAP